MECFLACNVDFLETEYNAQLVTIMNRRKTEGENEQYFCSSKPGHLLFSGIQREIIH